METKVEIKDNLKTETNEKIGERRFTEHKEHTGRKSYERAVSSE